MLDFILLGGWTGLCFAVAFYRWRLLVPLLFLLICLEGYLANYLYPMRTPLVARMILLVALYLGLLLSGEARKIRGLPLPLLGLLLFFAILQFLNPLGPTPLVSLLGLVLLFIHIPLVWVSYSYFKEKPHLTEFLYLNILFAVPVNLVGISEYFWGYGSLLPIGGRYVPIMTAGPLGEAYVRVISTFAAPGLYAGYSMTIVLLCVVLLWSRVLAGWKRRIALVSLLLSLLGLLVSGSRAPLLIAVTMVLLLLWFRGGLQGTVRALVLLGTAGLFGLFFLGERVQTRFADISVYEIWHRFYGFFGTRLVQLLAENPWGHGLGVAAVAIRHLGGGQQYELVESYFLKLLYEIGIAGLVFFALFVIMLLLREYTLVRGLQDPNLRWAGAGLLVFQVVTFSLCSIGTALESPPIPVFFWFFAGAVFAMPRLEATARAVPALQARALSLSKRRQPVLGRSG